jgi:hypothetical protein
MHDDQPLNSLYEQYKRGALTRAELECALFTFIRDQPWRYKLSGWDDDERDDFISDLYPVLGKAIDAYRETGSCFDAYLYSVIRWTAVGQRFRDSQNAAMERAYWREKSAEVTCDRDEEYSADDTGAERLSQSGVAKRPRQILVLTLKCCLLVSDDLCARVAAAVHIEPEELRKQINGLRVRIAERMQRRKELEEQAAAQYYRCLVLEAKASAVPEQCGRREKYEKSAACARKKLGQLRARAARFSVEATNREVAEALHVPKGTVDASLFFLKRKLAPLHDRAGERL